MDPEIKKQIREQLLQQRAEKEKAILAEDNGYELVYPSPDDSALNDKYETLIKKANDIWDDFTTGNKQKRTRESKLEVPIEKPKIQKKKIED